MNKYRTDIIGFAKKNGIIVVESPNLDVDGMIEKNKKNEIILTYNTKKHPNRQRFTIAHEMGHFLLGHLNQGKTQYRDSSKQFTINNYDIEEAEANKMAAQLLMPQGTLNHLIFEKGYSIEQTAITLEVSTGALSYRLKNLGIL